MKQLHGTCYTVSVSRALRDGGISRCACSISKKTAPRAVDRSRAKRRCREAFRGALSGVSKGAVVQVRIKPAALKAPFLSLKNEAEELVRRAGLS